MEKSGFQVQNSRGGESRVAWVKWEICTMRKEEGGLGVGSPRLQVERFVLKYVDRMIQSQEPWAIISRWWVEKGKFINKDWKEVDFQSRILSGQEVKVEGSLAFRKIWKKWQDLRAPARWMGRAPRVGLSLVDSQIWWLPWKGSLLALEIGWASILWARGIQY
eukprot:c47312_g1_i1 orf=2-490(+)